MPLHEPLLLAETVAGVPALPPRRRLPPPAPAAWLPRSLTTVLAWPLARFLLVGSLGLGADGSLFRALKLLQLADSEARAVSLVAATVLTWRLNRLLTFGPSGRSPAAESCRYALVALVVQGFNYLLFLTLRSRLPDVPDLLALFLSCAAAAGLSFTGHRFFTFARNHPVPPSQA